MKEKVFIKNNLGKNISVIVHYPNESKQKLAILCPGFLDSKDYDHLIELAKTLSENGYTAVRFDPTGTWDSDGDLSEYSATQYLNDIESIKNHMLTKNEWKTILIVGHSMGGRMSLIYTSLHSDISGVVAIMSSPGIIERKSEIQINKRDIPGNISEKREYRIAPEFFVDQHRYHNPEEMKNIHVPVLLIAGEKDPLAPPEKVKPLFDLANKPKEFVVMKNMGHDYRHHKNEIDLVNEKILQFLNKQDLI